MKKIIFNTLGIGFIHLFFCIVLFGQPKQTLISVVVTPTNLDWNYKTGEEALFEIKILKYGQLLKNVNVTYEIGPEQMTSSIKEEIIFDKGQLIVKGGTMNQAGFLRCKAWVMYEGVKYVGWGTAGFSPNKIVPSVKMPQDFNKFWSDAIKELEIIPMDAKMTLKPELCTSEINVYHVNLQNVKMPLSWRGSSRFYGMLSVPKKEGKYPAILCVPGAGVRAYQRDDRAAQGIIVFQVGIHGIPVDMEINVYRSLATGALAGYERYNLQDRDDYYYKRVILGCIRSVDFVYSLTKFDGENLGISGASQGGALSIITSSLDDRISYLSAVHPALSDMTGYIDGRAGGWPHMFNGYNEKENPNWVTTTSYYDVVNFAKNLKIPGWYSWGYNDNICPPTSMYAAYNVITSPKELHTYLDTGHWQYSEQWTEGSQWLESKLKDGKVRD